MGARSHFRLPAAGRDKPESSWAFYSLVDELEKCAVVYFIKEPFQIDVHNVLITIVDVFQGLCYRFVDVLFGAEAIAVFLERKFV
jgi:hypothetical protein